jgi:pilus assembly protein CpaF
MGRYLELLDLLERRAMTPEMAMVLEGSAKAGLNIIVSPPSSGKATLLRLMATFVPVKDLTLAVEVLPETGLLKELKVGPETQAEPAARNGKGRKWNAVFPLAVGSIRSHCVDHLLLSGCCGQEASDILQLMLEGTHVIATLESSSPLDALDRFKAMVLMKGQYLIGRSVTQDIASLIHLVVHTQQFPDGSRRTSHISEIAKTADEGIALQDIFSFEVTSLNRPVQGHFRATGVCPKFLPRLEAKGIKLPSRMFEPRVLIRV